VCPEKPEDGILKVNIAFLSEDYNGIDKNQQLIK